MIRVGLVGYGFMGGMHTQCYRATGKAQVVAVADVEPDRRRKAEADLGCKSYDSLDAMLASEQFDIVDICTPTYLHEEHVIAAAKSAPYIMCEKPMSLDVGSCDRMIRAVKSSGGRMMIGHVVRFWPEYQVAKEIVDSGRYGKVRFVSARRLSAPATWAWQGWLADPARSGGALLDLHIHDLDYIAYLVGSPKQVQCRGTEGPGGGLDSAMTLGWGHSSGASSYAEGSLDLAPGYPFTMALLVSCDKATIKYDSGARPSLMVYPHEGEAFAPELKAPEVGSVASGGNIGSLGGYYNEISYLVDCIEAGRAPEIVTPASAREAVRICQAARRSAETGQTAELWRRNRGDAEDAETRRIGDF